MKFKGSIEVTKESASNTYRLAGVASNPSAAWYDKQAYVQTTDDTQTDIATISLAEGEMVWVKAYVGGAKSGHTEAIGAEAFACARRQSGGNVTLLGVEVKNIVEDSSGSPSISIEADTGNQTVDIRVTGVAATTYNWVCSYSFAKV